MTYRYSEIVPVIGLTLGKKKRKSNQFRCMDILRLRPIIRHVRVILRCDNYRQGKFGKFIKSKFKILTCVVLLGRLNTMRGISAGKYDKGNKSIIMRGI